MRRLILLPVLALLFILIPAAVSAGSPAYVPGTEDVPLMPGLQPLADNGVVFDKPQGRIIEVKTKGAVKRAAVIEFYRSSLPPLGWHASGDLGYEREGERLSLDVTGTDGDLLVGFTLAPH